MKKISIYSLLTFVTLISIGQDYTRISGRIVDQKGRPISHAHIRINDTNHGTLSNDEGTFSLKVPKKYCSSSLQFTHVGYQKSIIPLTCKDRSIEVIMEEERIALEDVSVTALTARQVVEKSIEFLNDNYLIDTINYEVFYRFTLENSMPILLQEYVLNLLSRDGVKNDFYIKKIRSKSFTKDGKTREKKNKTSIIPINEMYMMLKYVDDFLEPKKMKRFSYSFGDNILLDGDTLYSVKIKAIKKSYTIAGELWIHPKDYGIVYLMDKSKDEFWSEKSIHDRTSHSYYTKVKGKWLFSHGHYSFMEKQSATSDSVYNEYITVVTDVQPNLAVNPDQKMNELYWVKTKKYYQSFDDEFWEDYNFIPLEKRFQEALKKADQ